MITKDTVCARCGGNPATVFGIWLIGRTQEVYCSMKCLAAALVAQEDLKKGLTISTLRVLMPDRDKADGLNGG